MKKPAMFVDKMIEWYYQVEEPEFLKFYNCQFRDVRETWKTINTRI